MNGLRPRFSGKRLTFFSVLFLFVLTLSLSAAAPTGTTRAADVLRDYAAARNFRIGSAVSVDWWENKLETDTTYSNVFKREFNMTVCENCMKMQFIQPTQGSFDWRGSDALMSYAEANGMTVRGHTLVWYDNYLPDWVKNGSWTRDSLLRVLRTHIETVVGRYRGRIKYWDVVNEAIKDEWDGGNALRDSQSIWQRVIGADFIRYAFEYAHAADPDAILYYNDYDTEWTSNAKSTYQYNMIRDLKNAGVPVNGVGFQLHHSITYYASYDNLAENFRRYRDLGLEVQITEADIRICQTGGTVTSCNPTSDQLNQQAEVYRNALRACLDASNCTGYTLWGFTDKYTWITVYWGPDAPLIYDTNFNAKPAYTALKNTLAGGGGGNGTPYSGTAVNLPGRVEAENYNLGGSGVAYNDTTTANEGGQYRSDAVDIENTSDTGGGRNVGWTRNSEWLKYTVNVQSTGTYTLKFRVASNMATGSFYLEVDGVNVTGTMSVSNTGGWQNWITLEKTGVALTAGQRLFRVVFTGNDFNLNWIEASSSVQPTFQPATSTPGSGNGTPYSGSPISLPGAFRRRTITLAGRVSPIMIRTAATTAGNIATRA